MSEKTYHALTNISLDGEEYPIGAAVPLTEKQAAQIKDAVTLKLATKQAAGKTGEGDEGLTQAQVVEAIEQLDSQNQTLWTKSGKPQIDALEALLKAPVSGAVRDAAWELFEAAGKGE